MSKSLLKLLHDQILWMQLQMMLAPIGSGERRVIMQDLRELKNALTAETVIGA